jgi:RNA polymerase sigma factor (TIGR02999 family)
VEANALSYTLNGVERGDREALDQLLPVVYQELRKLAARYLGGERSGHTLQPTALTHEVYLRLAGQRDAAWQGRSHFLCVAARAMRGVLVDHARRRKAQKRGGGAQAVSLDATTLIAGAPTLEFDDLNEALLSLARLSERQAQVVELRYFAGLTIEETATALGVSPVTVKRDWALARAWLYRELCGSES